MLNRYGPWLDINIVEPTGTESCQVRFEYYLEQSASLDAAAVKASLASSHEVQLEDVKLCEAVQRGLRSPAYDTGRSVAKSRGQAERAQNIAIQMRFISCTHQMLKGGRLCKTNTFQWADLAESWS